MPVESIAQKVSENIANAKTTIANDEQISNFSNLLKDVATDAINTQKVAEELSVQSVQAPESVDMQELITAISQAELSLQTMVAVRDKAVTAYNKIMDMPI